MFYSFTHSPSGALILFTVVPPRLSGQAHFSPRTAANRLDLDVVSRRLGDRKPAAKQRCRVLWPVREDRGAQKQLLLRGRELVARQTGFQQVLKQAEPDDVRQHVRETRNVERGAAALLQN